MANSDLINQIRKLKSDVDAAVSKLNIHELKNEKTTLQEQSEASDFWGDNLAASKIMQRISTLEELTAPWLGLHKSIIDLAEIAALDDPGFEHDIGIQLKILQAKYYKLKKQMRFNGPYDMKNAVLNIHAGAGGTDAQDWAQMLLRMYTRWAEASGMKVTTLDESSGEEAGIKSVSLEVQGSFAYGKLKGEHGVHRLVRLSPFNADAKRQTSFAKVEILPEIDEPEAVPIDEKELKIDVFRAGGHGGQSVNTTDSAVRITHLPTGIVVSIQNERSQLQNRETALTILRSKLAQLQLEQHAAQISELKGPNEQAAWGNQIRSYVLHPYMMVKDARTRHETAQAQAVLDGGIDEFIDAYLEENI
jgi:peptide chain release factor 2